MSANIPCPACGNLRTLVADSRASRGEVRRRRVCLTCDYRWTTYERNEGAIPEHLAIHVRALIENVRRTLADLEAFVDDQEPIPTPPTREAAE